MLRRLSGLFRRYEAQHLLVSRPGPALRGADGHRFGQVEQITLRGSRVVVSGWGLQGPLVLHDSTGQQQECHPDLPVTGAAEPDARGFELSMPFRPGPIWISCGADRQSLPLPGRAARGVARAALMPAFLLGLLRAIPLLWRWRQTRDPALRAAIRSALGLWTKAPTARLDPQMFAPFGDTAATVPADTALTIVVPVYNAFELLPEVLDRIERHTDLAWHLIAVEDLSSDVRVRPWLQNWAAAQNSAHPGRVTLLENETNQGFIGSVNRAFVLARARGGPVVLLNSDAFLPAGWAPRLLAPLLDDPTVASVTPMSNDAQILSVPVICGSRKLAPGQGDLIDRAAQEFAPGVGLVEAPTGVGFCMAIGAGWLDRAPSFDLGFGRGYGEEVDWCHRVRALGGRHLGLAGLFVEHRGGASFGSAEKLRLIETNNRLLLARHPGFGLEVQEFMARDPLASQRLALSLVWAANGADAGLPAPGAEPHELPLYIAHAMGGGAEFYLRQQIEEDCSPEGAGCAIVLRVGGPRRWQLELHLQSAEPLIGETDDFSLILRLLEPVKRRRIIYSCAVGDSDPASLPDHIRALRCGPQDRIEMLFHDYFPLSPSFTLLGSDGRFAGVPAEDSPDPAHRGRRSDGTVVSLAEWRRAWGRLAADADALVVFSQDSRARVAKVWPDLAGRLQVLPHRLHSQVPKIEPELRRHSVVAVLGNINRAKGLALLAELAEAAAGNPRFVVIGNTEPDFRLPASVTVHGDYRLADLPILAHRYGIGGWLIPSVWPETFSYTTHEALATGLPVFCLDLGAQAEAARRAPNGNVVPLAAPDAVVETLLQSIRGKLGAVT